jgi:hypothetical protein
MATASELENIRSNPIKEGLNAFQDLFHSICVDLSIAVSSEAIQVVFSRAAIAGMAQPLRPALLTNVYSY